MTQPTTLCGVIYPDPTLTLNRITIYSDPEILFKDSKSFKGLGSKRNRFLDSDDYIALVTTLDLATDKLIDKLYCEVPECEIQIHVEPYLTDYLDYAKTDTWFDTVELDKYRVNILTEPQSIAGLDAHDLEWVVSDWLEAEGEVESDTDGQIDC